MDVNRATLAQRFAQLDDDDLRRRRASGDMTPEAMEVAADELGRRGLSAGDGGRATGAMPAESTRIDVERLGDMLCLARMTNLRKRRCFARGWRPRAFRPWPATRS